MTRGKDLASISKRGKKMRLIDANALVSALNNGRLKEQTGRAVPFNAGVAFALTMVEYAQTIDAVPIETVCEMFGNEAPCNYGLFGVSVDDFMYSECGDWCESNCDKVPAVECWRKFFEAIEKWRKQND